MFDFYELWIKDDILSESSVPLDKIRYEILLLFNINSSEFKNTFNDYFSNSESEIFELFKNLYDKEKLEISDIIWFKDFLNKNPWIEHLWKYNLRDFGYKKYEVFIEEFDEYLKDIKDDKCSFFFAYIYFCTIDNIIDFLESSYIWGFKDDYVTEELLNNKYNSLKKLLDEKYTSLINR